MSNTWNKCEKCNKNIARDNHSTCKNCGSTYTINVYCIAPGDSVIINPYDKNNFYTSNHSDAYDIMMGLQMRKIQHDEMEAEYAEDNPDHVIEQFHHFSCYRNISNAKGGMIELDWINEDGTWILKEPEELYEYEYES